MKTMETTQSGLTTAPIPGLIRQLAVPASIGFFFNTMYNVVDTYFGGLISTQALAALSLSFPVFFLIIAIGHGVATGTTALIGTALGASDKEEARLFAFQGMTFGVLLSIVLTILGLSLSPFLFSLLGASDEYLKDCLLYMNTIFGGTIFFMLVQMLNAILSAQGDTKSYRNFLIIGFILNILLDPWFIYGGFGVPAMGITGIALATVLIQVIGYVYLGFRVCQTSLLSNCKIHDFFPGLQPSKDISRQGFPSSISFMTIAIGTFVIMYFVGKFGKEAIAAYGVGLRIEQIILLPNIGLNVATLTLVAQNSGAKLFDRAHEALKKALTYGGIISTIGTIVVVIFAKYLMAAFTDDVSVINIGTTYLRIDALVLYAYVMIFVNIAALQGLKRPEFGMVIGVYRQIVAPIIVFYLFTEILHFGLLAIWWGFFFITWSAAMIAFFYTRRALKIEN